TLTRAHREFEPSIIAKHALSVAQAFNRFYANVRVLDDHLEKDSRLALVYSVALMIEEDLRILGIQAHDEMYINYFLFYINYKNICPFFYYSIKCIHAVN